MKQLNVHGKVRSSGVPRRRRGIGVTSVAVLSAVLSLSAGVGGAVGVDRAATPVPSPSATTSAPQPDINSSKPSVNLQSPTPASASPGATPNGEAYLGQGQQRIDLGKSPQDNTALPQTALPQTVSPMSTWMAPGTQGLDVSAWQSTVDWQGQWNLGGRFAYIKASEGASYTSSTFSQQYNGAASVGMVRGAYHFALPPLSSGSAQANFLLDHGGAWTGDGMTLPPLLDIEYNPYSSLGDTCYNMAGSAMVNWIRDFSNTILNRIGRLPAIYSTKNWWDACTGSNAGFGANPLHIARYSTSVGSLPTGWSNYAIWQYSSTGPFAGDSDAFNGSYQDLKRFATFADGQGAILEKSDSSPDIYLVSGLTKYWIPDWVTYQLYAKLSPLETVSATYLDSVVRGPTAGRFMRSPDGTIYYNDNGKRFYIPTCSMMADFGGGSCANFVALPDNQINAFTDGGTLSNAVQTASGRQYYVSRQTVREYFDVASLTAAGLPSAVTTLSDAAMVLFAQSGAPIVRPDVIIVRREDRSAFIYSQGAAIPVPVSINDQNLWSRSLTAGLLDGLSIGQISQGPPFQGLVANTAGTAKYLLNAQGTFILSDASQWPNNFVVFSDNLISSLPSQGTLGTPAYIKKDGVPVVYRYANAAARSVPSWSSLLQLNMGSVPVIASLTPAVADSLTVLPGIQPLASQVVSTTNPTVYVVNDVDKLVPVEDFAVSSELGISGYTKTVPAVFSPYSIAAAPLTPVITCNSRQYLGRSSMIVALPATTSTAQLPTTSLTPSTCLALALPAAGAATLSQQVFVKSTTAAVVYELERDTKRPFASWSALIAANGGNPDVVIAVYGGAALNPIPAGAPIG